ncbi:MAG: glycosyl hydrolase family 18 protein [Lachnotalea sp.]
MMKKHTMKATILTLLLIILTFFFSSLNDFSFAKKPDRIVPTAPTNLTASNITNTSVFLSWNKSTDKIGVTEYVIFCNDTVLASTSATTYAVNALASATSYRFYVNAKDATGNISASCNPLIITTTDTSTVPVTTSTPEVSTTPVTDTQSLTKKVVGYYAAWACYLGYFPNQIDASKLTHINYAFANIGSDLKITLGYPDTDPNNIKLLNSLKATNTNLQTLISIGGWSWSGKFSDVALTDATRTTFADSCVEFIIQYGFDGVDLDWEYPVSGGLTTNARRPEDKQNFTLLLQKIREKLDSRGAIDNKHYLLTIAGGTESSYISHVEITKLAQYLDYATIMAYDLHGMWDSYTDLHSPLYGNNDISPQYKTSVDAAINLWLNASFPSDKLILGIPFYGYLYSSVSSVNNGLYQTYGGSNSISYQDIIANYLNKPGYTRYFHSQSLVPWLFNGSTFISYEDASSIAYKTQYIKSKNLGGAMVWELSQDPSGELLESLFNGIN